MPDIDHRNTGHPVCPWCGHEHEDAWDWSGHAGEHECDRCGRAFEWEREVIPNYHTKQLHPCPACGRLVTKKKDGRLALHSAPGKLELCPGKKENADGEHAGDPNP